MAAPSFHGRYIVHSGRVVLDSGAPVGGGRNARAQQQQAQIGPGGAFGESALMHDSGVDVTAVASGMVQLWRLHRLAFKLLQAPSLNG